MAAGLGCWPAGKGRHFLRPTAVCMGSCVHDLLPTPLHAQAPPLPLEGLVAQQQAVGAAELLLLLLPGVLLPLLGSLHLPRLGWLAEWWRRLCLVEGCAFVAALLLLTCLTNPGCGCVRLAHRGLAWARRLASWPVMGGGRGQPTPGAAAAAAASALEGEGAAAGAAGAQPAEPTPQQPQSSAAQMQMDLLHLLGPSARTAAVGAAAATSMCPTPGKWGSGEGGATAAGRQTPLAAWPRQMLPLPPPTAVAQPPPSSCLYRPRIVSEVATMCAQVSTCAL
jgi:hypothetical protein